MATDKDAFATKRNHEPDCPFQASPGCAAYRARKGWAG